MNTPSGQIDMNGNPCPPNSGTSCSPDKYDIMGFTRMRITALYRGNTAEAYTNCVSRIPGANASPQREVHAGYLVRLHHGGPNPQGGENFGLVPVQLVA